MEIHYRTAVPEDLEEVCGMVGHAVDTMTGNGIYQWDELYPTGDDFREDIDRKQLYVGVTDSRNMPQIAVAYVLNKEYDPQYDNGVWQHPEEPYYVVHRLCVNPLFQNQGIGGITLAHIEEQLLSWGIHAIRLDAFSQNPYALRMYARHSYRKTGDVDFRKGRFYLLEKYF